MMGMGAATEVLKKGNRSSLELIDGNVLLGGAKPGTTPRNDFLSQGSNASQLMHWATGVKYAGTFSEDRLRELFVGYELYHLEGWSQLAIDSINDLIAEEQGRLLGLKLLAGTLDSTNLETELLSAFMEARGWVGSLVRARQSELDRLITSENVPYEPDWSEAGENTFWGKRTIFQEYFIALSPTLGGSEAIAAELTDKLKQGSTVTGFIEVYALIEEADRWERERSLIRHSDPLKNALGEEALKKRMDLIKASWADGKAP